VFGHGLIFVTSGKDGPTLAVRPGGRGDVTDSRVAWRHKLGGPYVCSPVQYGDYLYVHTEQGLLSCYQATTGKLQYRERLEGKFIASSVAGDGKVYFTNEDGTTFVVKAGPRFELLARNALEEYTLASPAIAGGDLLLRTEKHL
jgi:outer membrane protein assembly factor BamB